MGFFVLQRRGDVRASPPPPWITFSAGYDWKRRKKKEEKEEREEKKGGKRVNEKNVDAAG